MLTEALEQQQGSVILADMMGWWVDEDQPRFRSQLLEMMDSLRQAERPVRQELLSRGEILPFDVTATPSDIGAVDSGDAKVQVGEITSLLVLAAHYRPERKPRFWHHRKTALNCEAFSHLGVALRLHAEMKLLASSEQWTIGDNSWWSYLMDCNKVITAYENLSEADGRDQFSEVYEDLVCNGLFVQALCNTNVIGMSKSGSSRSYAKRSYLQRFFKVPVTDLALFTKILEPGEYTKPTPIEQATEGAFGGAYGVEKRGWTEAERQTIRNQYQGRDNLHVTFFKPWPFKKAYRIEFQRRGFTDAKLFQQLLATVKEETQFPDIIEPVPQLMADRLSKQVGSISQMYGRVNLAQFPDIIFRTRSD